MWLQWPRFMSALLLHLTAVERLAAQVSSLPAEFSRALGEDLEYARFGAALPELPRFGAWQGGLDTWLSRGKDPHFTSLLTERAPVAFGLKAAELVANGALVGVDAGLAWLAGYFTQLCVRRALEPVMQQLMAVERRKGETDAAVRGRIEWAQSLFFMQELHGSLLVGTPAIRSKLQIRKASTVKGVGRGFYELIRVSSLEAFGEAPLDREVDGWARGVYLFSLALGSPLGKLTARTGARMLYRSQSLDVFATVDAGLDKTRELLQLLGSMIRRNSFGARSRQKFLLACPEGSANQTLAA